MMSSFPVKAEDWVARLQTGPLSPVEGDALEAWLAADPANRDDYLRCKHVGMVAVNLRARPDLVRALPAYQALQTSRATTKQRWLWAGSLAASASLLAAVVLLTTSIGINSAPTTIATRHGEQQTVTLEDGSKMYLNTDSTARVAFSASERRVELPSGEAYFEVTKDPRRPFIVHAGSTDVRVVGTKFSVRTTSVGADVVVSE